MKVSVVIPMYNEEENVAPLVTEFESLTESLPELEVVLVDDGSSDRTWTFIQQQRESHGFLNPLQMERNSGQSAAMLAGLRHATGDVLVTMDGDLQNDPSDIPALVKAMNQADVVCGYRAERRDSWSRRVGSRLGNRVRNWFTHDGVRDTGCSLKAFGRACVADLPPVDGVHRFMPAYFQLNGRTVTEVPVAHRERQFGQSKYTNLKRLPRTLFDLVGYCWYRKRYIHRREA